MYQWACRYRAAGRSVVPIAPGTKYPSLAEWGTYQTRLATAAELRQWFAPQRCMGIGIVAGKVSGCDLPDGTRAGLEFIDIDAPDIVPVFEGLVHVRGYAALLGRLPCEGTPKGGRHYGHLCVEWAGNTVFARRKVGTRSDGSDDVRAIIETRGEGGQCVVAPTPPGIHPEHPERGYTMVRGSWEAVPIITPEARQVLWECAKALNEYAKPGDNCTRRARTPGEQHGSDPGDIFNERVSPAEVLALLERHGWVRDDHSHGEVVYFRRPGKRKGWSATLGHVAPKVLYVFSSNAHPFEGPREDEHGEYHLGTAYDPFGIYARLEHRGDFKAAAKILAAQGYGDHDTSAPPVSDPWDGTVTFPVRPYSGYRGLRYGREVTRG